MSGKGNTAEVDWNTAFETAPRKKKGITYLEKLPETAERDIKIKASTVAELNDISQEEIEELLIEAENIMERIRSKNNE